MDDDQVSPDNELLFLIKKNNVQKVYDMLKSNSEGLTKNLDCFPGRYGSGPTALHLAAYYGRPEITFFLLQQGADPNAVNGEGASPLWLTIGYDSMTRMMQPAHCRWGTTHSYYYYKNHSMIEDAEDLDPYTDQAVHQQQEVKNEALCPLSGVEDYYICARFLLTFGANYNINLTDRCNEELNFFNEAVLSHYFHIARLVLHFTTLEESYTDETPGGLVALDMFKELFHGKTSPKIKRLITGIETRREIANALFSHGFNPKMKYEGSSMNVAHQLMNCMSKKPVITDTNGLDLVVNQLMHCKMTMVPLYQLLNARRVPMDEEDCYGMTPLSYAIEYMQIPMVEHILTMNASFLGHRNCKDKTPICALFENDHFLMLLKLWFGDFNQSGDPNHKKNNLEMQLAPYLWMVATINPYITNWKNVMMHKSGQMCKVFDFLVKTYQRISKSSGDGNNNNFSSNNANPEGPDWLLDLDILSMIAEAAHGAPPRKPMDPGVGTDQRYSACQTAVMPARKCGLVTAFDGYQPNLILTPKAMKIVNILETAYMEQLACQGIADQNLATMTGNEYGKMAMQGDAVIDTMAYFDATMKGSRRAVLTKQKNKQVAEEDGEEEAAGGQGQRQFDVTHCDPACQGKVGTRLVQGDTSANSACWFSQIDC